MRYLNHFPFIFLQKQVISHRVCWKTLCFEEIHLVFCLSLSFNTRNTWCKPRCYSSECSLKLSLISTFVLSHSSSCALLIISSARDWDVTWEEIISNEEEKSTPKRKAEMLFTCKTFSREVNKQRKVWFRITVLSKQQAGTCLQTRKRIPGNSLRHRAGCRVVMLFWGSAAKFKHSEANRRQENTQDQVVGLHQAL